MNYAIKDFIKTYLDNFYQELLFFAKRGDKQKFLEILLTKKNININYKDENGYTCITLCL